MLVSLLDWHSVGHGCSSMVKWKLQDVHWGQGQHQGTGHPSWQCSKVYWLHWLIKSQLPRLLWSCVSCNSCPSVPVWEEVYSNLFNKSNLFSSSGSNRAHYYYYHIYFLFTTKYFFSKSWLINYPLAVHGRWVKLDHAVSFDWMHELQAKFIFFGCRS